MGLKDKWKFVKLLICKDRTFEAFEFLPSEGLAKLLIPLNFM